MRCSICPNKYRCVPGDGPANSKYFFIGEAPGVSEDKGGRPFCLDETTLVLTIDLRWVPLDTVEIGDKLLAFDEFPNHTGSGVSGFAARQWRVAEVTNVVRSVQYAYTFETELGTLIGTPEHLVLTESVFKKRRWTRLDRLFYGRYGSTRNSKLVHLVPTWNDPSTVNQGWLAGFFDGEGCISRTSKTFGVGFTQNEGPTCQEALDKLQSLNFQTSINSEQRNNGVICQHHRIKGGFSEILRFLGSIRPNRLIRNAQVRMNSGIMSDIRPQPSKVLSRSKLRKHNVIDITTTTGTFIANGFAVHNCGKAGDEFNNNYLQLAGLCRDDIYITNTVKCRPDLNRKPRASEVSGCSQHWLPDELASVRPEVVFLMGATACGLVDGIDLDVEHGIPKTARLFGWEGVVVPMFHPAAGLHNTAMMIPMLEDWERVGEWLKNWQSTSNIWKKPTAANGYATWEKQDEFGRNRNYRLIENVSQFESYVLGADPRLIGGDTESHAGVEWSLQFSILPSTGRMILMKNESLVREFGGWLNAHVNPAWDDGELVLHNAEADLALFRRVGCENLTYRDTMQECYHFGNNYRQGLKALAYRHLGHRRMSWEEVVGGVSRKKLCEWLLQALWYVEENWRDSKPRISEKTGKALKAELVKHTAESELSHVLTHTTKSSTYDPWEKMAEFGWREADWLDRLEQVFGPMPKLGIANCELVDAVNYGCADADDTLRLALKFEDMRRDVVAAWGVSAEDRD